MTISINSSYTALIINRSLQNSNKAIAKSMQRLATGLRINNAGDDAGNLGVATRLMTQIRGLNVAKQNANEGMSITDVAYAALEETTNAIQNLRDLAVEARSSTSSADRTSLQNNVDELLLEIQRIATDTKYNGIGLLNGSFTNRSFQIGANLGEVMKMTISTASLAAIGMGANGVLMVVSADTADKAKSGASGTILRADSALDSISNIRARLSGVQSRFASIVNVLTANVEGYTSSYSGIMDTDVALEGAYLARASIIQQAGIAVLAQANQQPQQLLKLLG